ncbi:MAG: AAA family ATPase [Ardenticatenaceae bacterium]|nr:AAA family ATPase [Ardenticatenaceae bacterium]MCB8988462.1 AAA family ATPase [Ardenticatenaceae bacterium]
MFNFEQPHKPRALRLPAGCANQLRADMQELAQDLSTVLPAAFTSHEYQRLYAVPLPDLINFVNDSENSLLMLSDHYIDFPTAVIRQLAEALTCPVLVIR